jgi:hypothetical protein
MLEFSLKTPNGRTRTLNSQQLLQQYGAYSGFQPIGLTQDGASGIYQTPQGMQTIPFHEAIQEVGGEISEYKPQNAVPAENMLKYRMALDSISDPDVQQAYFKTVATKDFGIENPIVLRSGTDTFLWDQSKGNWVALTNQPGLDMTDVASGAATLGKGALSIAGGVGGAALAGMAGLPSGPGAIAAGALGAGAGSAAGSALGDLAQAGIMGAVDPSFRQNYDLAKEAGGIGQRAAISGALGAAGPIAGAVLPRAMGAAQAMRPSNVMTGVGQGVGSVGKGVSAVGRGLDSTVGRMGLQVGLDPTGLSAVGAVGGLAKEYAPQMASGAAKAWNKAREGVASMRGMPAPAAQPLQGLQDVASGIAAVGGAAEKVGRGVEAGIIGTTKGLGAGLQGAGTGLRGAGAVARGVEGPAARGMARELDFQGGWANVPQPEDRIYQAGLDMRNPGGLQVMQTSSPTLADAIAARGGIYNVLR